MSGEEVPPLELTTFCGDFCSLEGSDDAFDGAVSFLKEDCGPASAFLKEDRGETACGGVDTPTLMPAFLLASLVDVFLVSKGLALEGAVDAVMTVLFPPPLALTGDRLTFFTTIVFVKVGLAGLETSWDGDNWILGAAAFVASSMGCVISLVVVVGLLFVVLDAVETLTTLELVFLPGLLFCAEVLPPPTSFVGDFTELVGDLTGLLAGCVCLTPLLLGERDRLLELVFLSDFGEERLLETAMVFLADFGEAETALVFLGEAELELLERALLEERLLETALVFLLDSAEVEVFFGELLETLIFLLDIAELEDFFGDTELEERLLERPLVFLGEAGLDLCKGLFTGAFLTFPGLDFGEEWPAEVFLAETGLGLGDKFVRELVPREGGAEDFLSADFFSGVPPDVSFFLVLNGEEVAAFFAFFAVKEEEESSLARGFTVAPGGNKQSTATSLVGISSLVTTTARAGAEVALVSPTAARSPSTVVFRGGSADDGPLKSYGASSSIL